MALLDFFLFPGYMASQCSEYSNTSELLEALNYDTSEITIAEDFSIFSSLMKPYLCGNGSITIGYLKVHVTPTSGGVAPFTITSTFDSDDNETFNFTGLNYVLGDVPFVAVGNMSYMGGEDNGDEFLFLISPSLRGGYGEFTSDYLNPPSDHILLKYTIGNGTDSYFTDAFGGSSEEKDFYLPILVDLLINEAYCSTKLDVKYVEGALTEMPIAGTYTDEIGAVCVPSSFEAAGTTLTNCISLDDEGVIGLGIGSGLSFYNSAISVDTSSIATNIAGAGLTISNNKINVDNASSTVVGGIKYYLDGDVLYITTNGTDPTPTA